LTELVEHRALEIDQHNAPQRVLFLVRTIDPVRIEIGPAA
jgi:hypothetical protein